tara:strand:+ start:40 stop:1197 length:1158 start_codon:yes stop_codon:yes gene_type:complete
MLKIFRLNETLKASPSRTFFLTRYPKHFSKSNKDEKYGNCLNPDDLYLISIIADGMHQNVSLVNSYKYIRELQKTKIRFICLDKYISLTDILVSFLKSFTITARFMKIINSEFRFGKIDISLFVTDELTTSVLRIPRLMMYKNSLINLMHKHKPQRFVYYLFEFCYGRFFTYIFKQYFPNIHTIGFQHGPNSQRHIMFYLAVDEGSYQSHDYLRFLPMPNEVLAENKQAQLVYETGGYRNIKLMDRIYRLDYLDKINRKNIVGDSVLVAAALHDGYQLFRYLTQYMKENENITFFFKLHPLTNKNIFRYIERNKIKNTIIAHKELYYYLSIVSEVIVTQSSVGYEAYILGIPVRVISLPNKINDSCLVDIYENGEKKNITIDHFL